MEEIHVSISGANVPSGGVFAVRSQSLGSAQPQGTGQTALKSPLYFDVHVHGVSGGTAIISITNDAVEQGTKMQYWDSGKWVDATGVSVKGKTVTGSIGVGSLGGTPIVIGI